MAEYIEKSEIIKAIAAEACHCLTLDKPAEARGYIGAKTLIESRKAADVAEVRHGRWIHDINNQYGCSECMRRETMSPKRMKPYCPNCGARMDKEDEQ